MNQQPTNGIDTTTRPSHEQAGALLDWWQGWDEEELRGMIGDGAYEDLDEIIAMGDPKPDPLRDAAPELFGALQGLLDDLSDSGEDRNQETGEEYDSVTTARTAIAKATA